MPGSAEKVIYFSKCKFGTLELHFELSLNHYISHHRRQEIVIIARCGLGDKRVDKRLGITGFAHSRSAAAQYGKRVPIFPDQTYLDVHPERKREDF